MHWSMCSWIDDVVVNPVWVLRGSSPALSGGASVVIAYTPLCWVALLAALSKCLSLAGRESAHIWNSAKC
jgi:hypothetical protein